MSNWFECKVKYMKVDQNGKDKRVTEPYLVDAVSFTDAEKRINELLEPYISGEFLVTNLKIANYSEIHPSENGDRWFKCKVSYILIDEERGVERKDNTYMLVQANDVKEAYSYLEADLKSSVNDFEIPSVQESPIMDVFPYYAGNDSRESGTEQNLTPVNDFESGSFEDERKFEMEGEEEGEVSESSEEEPEEA